MTRRRITAALATGAAVIGTAAAMAPAQAAPTTSALPALRPAWTATATSLGAAPAGATVHARVWFQPRGGSAALRNFVATVSDPQSAQYGHFLSKHAYTARFGVRHATVAAAATYLRSKGLQVGHASTGNHWVTVTGTVATVEQAFGTQLDRYRHEGQVVRAPASAVHLPATIASTVLTVTGLDTTTHVMRPASTPQAKPPAGFRNAQPCSKWFGEYQAGREANGRTKLPKFNGRILPYSPCGYTGPQLRSAYEGNTTADGSGITVAITDAYASPTMATDANRYAKLNGDRPYAPGQYTEHLQTTYNQAKQCGPSGWYGEETLDVEAVHAMAPGANIEYYAAKNCNDSGFLPDLQQVVDDDTAQLVTNSWDGYELSTSKSTRNAYDNIFMQGAAEGISFFFSSGDDGDEHASTGKTQVDYPASSPYVTAVGGTSTAINVNGNLRFSAAWGTNLATLSKDGKRWVKQGFDYGGGGGTSVDYARPSYQDGWTSSSKRQVPDVSMDADPGTGMLVGETQTFPNGVKFDEYRIGGTSLASPLLAGFTAVALGNAGSTTGLGVANYSYYAQGSTGTITDVAGKPPVGGVVRADYANGVNAAGGVSYSVRTFGNDSSLHVTRGYDVATGLGVPNASFLTALGPVS